MSAGAAVQGFGPQAKRGAFSLTFDNFGEAAEIELGRHPPGEPVGRHFTATDFLPDLLEMVDGLPVTYFIEASNVALYPQQIRRIHEAGHEVALHAWRHEHWVQQDAATRHSILERSLQAFESIGIRPRGFRPPGGVLPEDGLAQFKAAGLRYCSPLGDAGDTHLENGVAVLPFAWKHVDAYMLDPLLGAMRARFGDPEQPVAMDVWRATIHAALEQAQQGQHVTLIFHPFLFGRDAAMTSALKELISALRRSTTLWVAPCDTVAAWLEDQGRATAS